MTYDGFPVDVAEERLEPNSDYIVSTDGAGRPATKPRLFKPGVHVCCQASSDLLIPDPKTNKFTEADLLRLAGQLERAELQGYRFERYARCGVGEHRHRWAVASWLCQIIRRLKW